MSQQFEGKMDVRTTQGPVCKVKFNNDTDRCVQALEQESQRNMYGAGSSQAADQNSHQFNHNNSANHSSPAQANTSNRNNSQLFVGGSVAAMPRYQELPVRHEPSSASGTHHISTVQHTITPPVHPKPVTPSMGYRPRLMIDPANQGKVPYTAPVAPTDFSPFTETPTHKRTVIPNIPCVGGGGTGGGDAAAGGSPSEQRRPVRVISLQGQFSGGTVTSRTVTSPTEATRPQFRVQLGDGGGVCLSHTTTTPSSSPSQPSSTSNFTSPSSYSSSVQETDRTGVHSSSIFIDSMANSRRTNVQETAGDSPQSIHPHMFGGGGMSVMGPQGPASLPGSRTMQPLSVSLSSQVSNYGSDRGGPVFNQGYYGGSSGAMSMGGGRFMQDTPSRSPPRNYPVSMMNNLSLSPNPSGGVNPMYPSYPASSMPGGGLTQPLVYTAMTPAAVPRSPYLQHQRSTGSSTSRSNSMDSEHGSAHLTGGEHTPPLPHTMQRMGMNVPVAVPVLSPSSSQSSLSSESSARERDQGSAQRPRSGSMQEEAAYSQALLEHQRQRMQKLTEDIEEKRQLVERLRQEVSNMEKSEIGKSSARTSFPTTDDIARLCENNRRLQTDIQLYLNEIDMYRNGQTPFSIIDPMDQQNFFKNMPTGPNDLRYTKPSDRPRPSPSPPPMPPPRPPPPRRINSDDLTQQVPPPDRCQITSGAGSGDSEEGESWSCSACTFRNHPALKKCEMCEMPRLIPGS